eukprot:349916_1
MDGLAELAELGCLEDYLDMFNIHDEQDHQLITQFVRDERWILCRRIPENMEYGRVVRLNDNELIMSSGQEENENTGIYKYNIITNEWKQIIKYPKDLYNGNSAITLDDNTKNKLYMMNNLSEIIMFDLESNKMEYLHEKLESLQYGKDFASNHSVFVSVENTIHSIGGSLVHLIWNKNTNIITKIDHPFNDEVWGVSVIYVPSKQCILLIGGHNGFLQQDAGIWIFSLVSNKWRQIEGIIFKCHHVRSLALSFDEKYVIIAGGRVDHTLNEVNNIHILDIESIDKMKLMVSNICCPSKGPHNVICMRNKLKDKILVNGWIRLILKDTNHRIASEIVNLILELFNEEELHWLRGHSFEEDKNDHFSISITHILSVINM